MACAAERRGQAALIALGREAMSWSCQQEPGFDEAPNRPERRAPRQGFPRLGGGSEGTGPPTALVDRTIDFRDDLDGPCNHRDDIRVVVDVRAR